MREGIGKGNRKLFSPRNQIINSMNLNRYPLVTRIYTTIIVSSSFSSFYVVWQFSLFFVSLVDCYISENTLSVFCRHLVLDSESLVVFARNENGSTFDCETVGRKD